MDVARQRHEDLSIMGILFVNSVAEGEAVWMRRRGVTAAFLSKRCGSNCFHTHQSDNDWD